MKPINSAFFFLLMLMMFAIATPALCQPDNAANVLVERVGDTAFIQLRAPSFQALSPRQQALAYWLTQASIAIDPIIYDQLSAYGLQQKRLLEEIMARPQGNRPGGDGEDRRIRQTFLGQPRQSQRDDVPEISARLYL